MLINNVDISSFKGKVLQKKISNAEIVIFDDWLRNAQNPLYLGKQEKFKKINIDILVQDVDDESCLYDISNINLALEKNTIKFKDLTFLYDCTISDTSHERLQNGYYLLSVELKSGYAYLPSISMTVNQQTQSINIQGNLQTPAKLTLTPSINMSSVALTGFGRTITIKNLHANNPVIIDGETCLVTEGGLNKYSDSDFWGFPVLQPGSNTIGINPTGISLKIEYKPHIM